MAISLRPKRGRDGGRAREKKRRLPGGLLEHGDVAEFARIRRRLGIALAALVAVLTVGVIGYSVIGAGRYGLVDAAYMTVITLTTVGFTEIIDMSGDPAGRVFTIFLLVGGMGIFAYTLSVSAAFLIEGQFHRMFARRRMEKTIQEMSDHYVVCGDSGTCWYVARELILTGRECLLVVPTDAALAEVQERVGEVLALVGDASGDDVLLGAGVDRAAGVIFCMESDKDNLVGVFTARRLAPRARIVAAAEVAETRSKLEAAGADAVVSPSHIGGLRMASELVRPTVVSFLDQMLRVQGGNLRVEQVDVPEGVDPAADTLAALRIDDIPTALVVAVRPPRSVQFVFKPDPDTPLEPGMSIVVMADADGRKRVAGRLDALAETRLRSSPA